TPSTSPRAWRRRVSPSLRGDCERAGKRLQLRWPTQDRHQGRPRGGGVFRESSTVTWRADRRSAFGGKAEIFARSEPYRFLPQQSFGAFTRLAYRPWSQTA